MNFEDVALAWQKIDETTLRNTKTKILAELLVKAEPIEARLLCYLVMGRIAPLYEPVEFGMAEKSIIKTVAWNVAESNEEVMRVFKLVGDLGEVAMQLGKREQKDLGMSIVDVHKELAAIAEIAGKGSQEAKQSRLGKLATKLSPLGMKYLIRLVGGKLRLGFSDLTILDALSCAIVGDKSDRVRLERAYSVSSDLGKVAMQYLIAKDSIDSLQVTPGTPVRPMRAERLGTITEIVEKLRKCAVEPKLDGMRVQIHAYNASDYQSDRDNVQQAGLFGEPEKDPIEVRIFSRGLEDISLMFPDIIADARRLALKVGAFVLDGEAIGIRDDGTFLPFQETMKRKRKYGVSEKVESIPLKVFVFDVLFANGAETISRSYELRRETLAKLLGQSGNQVITMAESKIVDSVEAMQTLFDEAMQKGTEGILVKKIDSIYRAGARDFAWVKYKRAHETELADTIDAVVMGAYVGKGKRQHFGVGAFLVGVVSGDKFVTVAKIGTGLTDEQFGELYQKIQKSLSKTKIAQYELPSSLEPDMWLVPEIVVEIEADEITESPMHSSGYALRFPRLLRFREDKQVGDITSVAEVAKLFKIGRRETEE